MAKALDELEVGVLPWEVVYAMEALRTIPRLHKSILKGVILTIHQIASGEWTKKSCKQLQGTEKLILYEGGLKLFSS